MTGDPFDVVLVGGDDGAMAEAIALAGGRITATLPWEGPLLAEVGALVAVDLAGLGEAALDDLTPLDRADLVACELDQLDRVADAVLLNDAQLLCAPSMPERVAALAMAAAELGRPDAVREGEAARLRRMSTEVGRIAQVLARLAEDEGASVADRRPAFDAGPPPSDLGPDLTIDAAAVRGAIRARRLRAQFFGPDLFEDPAWDMLLDLFAAELEGGRVSVSSLCIAAHVAPTTALRWITRLTDAGLFERRPDPQDRRRVFIALSARGSAAMRGYVAALGRQGLSLA